MPVCKKCGGVMSDCICPPQAEVVASSRSVETVLSKFVKYEACWKDELKQAWVRDVAAVLKALPPEPPPAQGKENTCSDAPPTDVPPSSSSSSPSSSSPPSSQAAPATNPPAWVTPSILAACGPGEVLYWVAHTPDQVRAYPSMRIWSYGKDSGTTLFSEEWCKDQSHESYRIPTAPAAKCDGSGKTQAELAMGGVHNPVHCPGCPARKPEPKDGADWTNAKVTPIYKPARLDLDKVRELCGQVVKGDWPKSAILAREVLARLEGK